MDIGKNRFYVGTSRGVLISTGDKPLELKVSRNNEKTEVTALCEGRTSEEIILGHQSGHAYIFNTETNEFDRALTELEGEESITGVGCIKKFVTLARRNGVVNIWNKKKNDFFDTNLDDKGSLEAMECNKNRENVLGTGGEHNDFKLWDVNTQQCIFKAKSLGHDSLQLPMPASIRGISFFTNELNLAACCTKEGHVLLYDDRTQRRPIIKLLEKQASYTTISNAHRDWQVLVGTAKGYMQWLDLRTAKVLKTYTTFTGSVTSIVCDPMEPFVASVSLDRHLRVHNLETKDLVYKCYMKQNLTKLLVKPIVKGESNEQEDKNETLSKESVDQEYDELFINMEEICEKEQSSTKRKSSILRKVKKKKPS